VVRKIPNAEDPGHRKKEAEYDSQKARSHRSYSALTHPS